MGYECPVCSVPQADDEHLAHHLAITAITHGDEHEDWLDEHAPGWGENDPAGLAERVVEHVDETAHETVFEDTTDNHDHSFEAEVERQLGGRGDRSGHGGRGDLTSEADAVLAEARELTAQMLDEDDEQDDPS